VLLFLRNFLYHEDQELGALVVSIMDFPYEVSENWKTHYEGKIPTRDELYLEEVGSTLTYLKLRKIQRLMDMNQRDLEKSKNAEEQIDSTTVVFNGDVLTSLDLNAVIARHHTGFAAGVARKPRVRHGIDVACAHAFPHTKIRRRWSVAHFRSAIRPEDRHAPQSQRIAEDDRAHPETPDDCSTGKGPHHSARSCSREVDDGNQREQVCAGHNDDLLSCHVGYRQSLAVIFSSTVCSLLPTGCPIS
jgi:hypothetical protein